MNWSVVGLALSVATLLVVGFALGTIAMGTTDTYEAGQDARSKIYKCEKSIPRDKHCVIVAKEAGQ